MIAVYLSPVYVLVNIYIAQRFIRWLGACGHFFQKKYIKAGVSVVYALFAFSILIGFFGLPGQAERTVVLIGNYWLGFLEYAVMVVGVMWGLCFLLRHILKNGRKRLGRRRNHVGAGIFCLAVIILCGSWGTINARIIHTTDYSFTIHKDAGDIKEMKVVLVADLHMGYNIGCRHIEDMVETINAQKPDLVVIAGDIFDNSYEALEDPDKLIQFFQKIESRYGIYACYGNHDVSEKILAGFTFSGREKKVSDPRMDEFLEKAGVVLLRDEGVLVADSFYLYGRPDAEKPGRGIDIRKSPEEITENMDQKKPIIVIDHEPKQLQELADAGVDVDLCGHTHDGQIFPVNLITSLVWENSCGYLKKGNMHNVVTSGVGVFGPNMRVGTKAEICSLTIRFQK